MQDQTKFKLMIKFIKLWLPFIACAVIIAYLSNQPSLRSSLPDGWDFVFRKIAHMLEYAILTWLTVRVLRFSGKVEFNRALVLGALIAVLYAVSDEYHQTFIPGREGTARDVIIDSIGVAVFVWYYKRVGGNLIRSLILIPKKIIKKTP